MVHLTIVLPLTIKAASFGSTHIKEIKGCLWSTNSQHEKTWTQINQTIAGSVLIRLRRTAAISTLQTNSSAASVVAATGCSLGVSRGPVSLKPFSLPLRTDAIWKADRKQESSDRACVLPLGTRPSQTPPF